MRGWAEAAEFAMPPLDILNFGRGNYLFGWFFAHIIALLCPLCSRANSEFTTGIPPVLFALFVASWAWLWRRRAAPPPLLVEMAVAAILSWFFCQRFADVTPWRLVYDWLPGAKALRVVSRYQLVLTTPVLALTTCCLADLSRTIPRTPALLLCALLLAEELGTGPVGLDRSQELQRVAVPAPPAECGVFFVTAASDQKTAAGRFRALLPHNVDAMLIAEMKGLPTVNGFASFNPPDWNLGNPDAPDYTKRVVRYAARHGLNHMCQLNLETHRWLAVDERP